jgi:hypothetical protein
MNLNFRKFIENIPAGYNRLVIMDFDDTLVFSPTPEVGKAAYQTATGEPWPHKGWWGQPKSLEPPVFNGKPEELNHNVKAQLDAFKEDPHTYVVVMTGRIAKFENRVKEILNNYGIHAHEYIFRGQKELTKHPEYPHKGDTLDYKIFVIVKRLMSSEMQSVEIFDDREEHMSGFIQLGRDLKANWPNLKSVIIHDVRQNQNHVL